MCERARVPKCHPESLDNVHKGTIAKQFGGKNVLICLLLMMGICWKDRNTGSQQLHRGAGSSRSKESQKRSQNRAIMFTFAFTQTRIFLKEKVKHLCNRENKESSSSSSQSVELTLSAKQALGRAPGSLSISPLPTVESN